MRGWGEGGRGGIAIEFLINISMEGFCAAIDPFLILQEHLFKSAVSSVCGITQIIYTLSGNPDSKVLSVLVHCSCSIMLCMT